jgi:hypothetical protein
MRVWPHRRRRRRAALDSPSAVDYEGAAIGSTRVPFAVRQTDADEGALHEGVQYAGGELVFASVGEAVTLYPQSVFVEPGRIHLMSHVIISELCWLHAGVTTVIGNFVHLANHASIAGGGACILEDFAGFSGVRAAAGGRRRCLLQSPCRPRSTARPPCRSRAIGATADPRPCLYRPPGTVRPSRALVRRPARGLRHTPAGRTSWVSGRCR